MLFRDCLQVPGSFSIAVELVSARGLVSTERSRALVEKARTPAADPRIDALSITDNPGRGWKLASEGFDNVVCLSGDYPLAGYGGTAAPVFDIDSVGLLKLYSDMNAGPRVARSGERLDRTNFFLGCVATNHKLHEREVVPQYQRAFFEILDRARDYTDAWSQAYERLKAHGEEQDMLSNPVVMKDNTLARTSAWANDLLGRDHHARSGQFNG